MLGVKNIYLPHGAEISGSGGVTAPYVGRVEFRTCVC